MKEPLTSSPVQKYRLVAAFRKLLIIEILLGLYTDCFRLTFVRYFARVYCVVVCFSLCSYMYTDCSRMSYFSVYVIAQWIANILLALLRGKDLLRFCVGIKKIDMMLKQPDLTLNPSISRLIFLRLLSFNTFVMVLNFASWVAGYMQYSTWLHSFIISYIWSALIMSHMTKFIIFEITSQRVKLLRDFFQSNLSKTCLRKLNSTSHTIRIVREGMAIYKYIHKNFKMTLAALKMQVTVALCSNFFNMLVHCCDILNTAATHRLNVWIVILEHGISCVLCCLPALFAERAEREVQEIKLVFEDELLLCNSADLQAVIENSTDYLALCPIKATISRAFSFGMNLPCIFFSLFATYVVVTIQVSWCLIE